MKKFKALLITDRVIDPKQSSGFRWRVRALRSWLEEAGFEVLHQPVTKAQLPSAARRLLATVLSVGRLREQANEFDFVLLYGLNAPHMVWLTRRLASHGAVVLDLGDSLALWAQATPWRAQPFFRLKTWMAARLLPKDDERITCSYIASRDAHADSSAGLHNSSIVIPITSPTGLGDMEQYVGPPRRIVVAADLGSPPNRQAFLWFEDAVRSGELDLRIPVEIYGPVKPDHELPEGIMFKGWAPRLGDIYEGQTGVFAPTIRGAGVQGKYLEAVAAGRPVVVGRQPAEAIPPYEGALLFESRRELVSQIDVLQTFARPLSPGSMTTAPASSLERSVAVVRGLASRRRARANRGSVD